MKIYEMTMRGGDFNLTAAKFVAFKKEDWKKNGKHVGDIENLSVLQDGYYFSVWDNDTIVACTSLTGYADYNIVDEVWVNPEYRGQKIFSKLIWFYKTRLNRNNILIGQVHSKDMQEVIKGLSRFDKYWYNIKTKEKKLFSLDTLDDFYSYTQVTPWRLLLENDGDFSTWPKFSEYKNFILEAYDPYID